jgi:hypothetical protein
LNILFTKNTINGDYLRLVLRFLDFLSPRLAPPAVGAVGAVGAASVEVDGPSSDPPFITSVDVAKTTVVPARSAKVISGTPPAVYVQNKSDCVVATGAAALANKFEKDDFIYSIYIVQTI